MQKVQQVVMPTSMHVLLTIQRKKKKRELTEDGSGIDVWMNTKTSVPWYNVNNCVLMLWELYNVKNIHLEFYFVICKIPMYLPTYLKVNIV